MSDDVRRIVAMGGGGFSMDGPDNTSMDDFVFSLTGKARPRVCFLATATGDPDGYIEFFHSSFANRDVDTEHLKLFGAPRTDIREFLLGCDVIYVGGGNTANMLAIWRVHGVDRYLREAWERGIVLTGLSAGMICWFEASVTDSFGPLAPLNDGLGLLPGSACPHMDGEADRRPTYHGLIADGFPEGYAADDGAAVVFTGTELTECVASRPGASCYRVTRGPDGVVEEKLPTRLLS